MKIQKIKFAMSDNIQVVVRVRPLLPRESGDTIHWKVVSDKNSLIQVTAVDKSLATYMFDRVYDTSSTNGEVYQAIVQPIVAGALDGINGTVFAYGQTSSGKTHTMMGDEGNPGIIPLTIRNIFQGIEDTPDRQYLVRASYMEIYNEQIADLLAGRSNIPGNKGLAVREDGSGLIYVAELKEECVTDESKLLSIMTRGDRNRQVGCTNMNDRSSRSHTIFRIIVESQCAVDGDDSVGNGEDEMAVTVSHLNLVDLAGSENAAQTGATGDRLKEGGYINKSLFMLGRVISQLSDGESYVNYRDSKLTRILQCSLGGNAQTAIICNITPVTVDQTHSTLRFASRAKNIKNKPIVNEVLSEAALLKRYSKEINLLKTALERERQSNRADEVLQVKEKLDEVEQMNQDLKSKVRKLNEKLVTSSICRTPKRADKKSKSSRRETWSAPFQKSRTTLLPLDLASINAKFSAPFLPPSSAVVCGGQQERSMLPVINETPSLSDCSFATAAEEFNDTNSSFLRRLDQSAINRLDSSVLELSGTEVFPIARSIRPKVSFASPALADETLEDDAFHQPQSNNITRRRRGGRPPPPSKVYLDAEVQTDDTLVPKLNLLCSPRTPRRAAPSPSTPDRSMNRSLLFSGTPVGETPRMTLRARISKLSSVLSEKDGRVDELKQELEELQELHDFVEEDFRFREESLLAKLDEEPADLQLQDMAQQVTGLKRSLHDSEGLLMDANKRLSHQTQKLQCQALELEQLRTENVRLEAACKYSAEVKIRCNQLQTDHDRLVKELHEKRDTLDVLEKDRHDFDIMLELRLEKQQRIERDLRRSLEEAWADLAKVDSGDSGVVKARLERTADLENQLRERDEAVKELEEQIIRSSEFDKQKKDFEDALKTANDAAEHLRLNLASKEIEVELLKSKLHSNAIEAEVLSGPGAPTEASPPRAFSSFVDTQHAVPATLLDSVTNDSNRLALAASDTNLQLQQEASKNILHVALEGQVESLTLKCRELEELLACKEESCFELSNKVYQVLDIEKAATHNACPEINSSQPADILPDEESMEVDPVDEEELSVIPENNCTNCDSLEKLLESLKRKQHECEVEKGIIDCTECEKLASSIEEQDIANKELKAQMDAMKSTIADLEVEIEALKCSLQNAIKVDSSNTVSNCGGEVKDEQAKFDFHSSNNSLNADNLKAHSDTNNATLVIQLQDFATELQEEKLAAIPSASNETTSEVDSTRLLHELQLTNAVLEKKARDLDEQIVCYVDKQRLLKVRVEELDNALSSLGEEKVELLLKLEDASNKETQKIQQILEDAEQENVNFSTQRLLLEKSLSLATEEIASLKEQLSLQQAQADAHRTSVAKVESLKSDKLDVNGTSVSDQSRVGLEQLNTEKVELLARQVALLKSENKRLCEELEEIESLNLDHMSLKQEIEEMIEEVERLRENKKGILEDSSRMEEIDCKKVSSDPLADEMKDSGLLEIAQSNLHDELTKLKCEKQKLQCQVEELSARLTDILDKANVNDREVVILHREKKELMMEIEELKALNCRESYETFIEELNAQITSLETDKTQLLAEVQSLREVNTQKLQVDVELETLVNEHANLKLQRDELLFHSEESKANGSCSSSESLKKEISDLTQEKLSLTTELEAMRARLCSETGGADFNKLTEEVETISTEKSKLLEMIANLPKGVSIDEETIHRSALNEEEIVVLRQQVEAFKKSSIEMTSELQEVDRQKSELIAKSQGVSFELEEQNSQNLKLRAELLEAKRLKQELVYRLEHFNHQTPEVQGVSRDEQEQQQLMAEVQELTRRKDALVLELQEINRQKQDLFAELQQLSRRRNALLDETDDMQTSLLAAAAPKRRSSAPRRKGSSVSTLKDESCLLQDSAMAYPGDDTLMSGSRSTKAALSAVSHRLLHTLTLFEESVVQPALDRTDINATALSDRTVSSEEFSAEQLQEVKDQLLELQRALLAASLSETSSAASSSVDCCLIYAENEVECHTLRLLESIASDYIAHSCQISRLTKNISAVDLLETTSQQLISDICVFNASVDNLTTDHDQSQSRGIDKHAQQEQTSSISEDDSADRVTQVDESMDVNNCPEMLDASDCDVTMGVTLRYDLSGRRSRLFDPSSSSVVGPSLNTSKHLQTRVSSLADEMQAASADYTILAPEPVYSKDDALRSGTALSLADELRLADVSGNETVCLATVSELSLADDLGLVDISIDKTRNQETDLVSAGGKLCKESSIIETALLSERCVTNAELSSATQKSQKTVIDAALDGQNICADELLKELNRVREENINLVEKVEILSLDLEQHKKRFINKTVQFGDKESELLDQTEPVRAWEMQFNQNLMERSENDYDVMDHATERQNSERYSSTVSNVKYDDCDAIKNANESQLFDQSIHRGSTLRGYCSESDNNLKKDLQNLTTGELLQKIGEQEAANARLRSKLSEANLVVEEVHCLRWQANDLEVQKKALELEIEELKDALQESGRTTPSGINDKIEDKDSIQAERTDNCKHVVEDPPEHVITTDELELRFEGVFKKLDNKETKLESFESQVSSLEEIIKLQASSSSGENRLVNSQQLYRVLAEKHRLAVEFKNFKENLDALDDREALEDSLDKVLEQLGEKKYEMALLTRKLDDTNEDLAVRTAMLESITSKYEDHMLECALQQGTLGDEIKRREEQAKLLLLLAEKEAVLHDVSVKLKERNLQVTNLEMKLDSTITKSNEAVDELKKALLEKDVTISELNQKSSEHEKNMTELEDKVGSASQRLQTELELRGDNLMLLSSQLVQVKDELNAASSAKEELSNVVKACLEKVSSVLRNPNCVGSSNPSTELVELLDALLASSDTKCDELKLSTTAVQNLHIILDKKTKELESTKEEHTAEIQTLLQILGSKDSEIRDTVETLEKAKTENEAQLKHQLSLKINQLQQIELTAEELETELKLKEELIETQMIQINSDETKLTQMNEDLIVLSSKLNEMKVESNKKIEAIEKLSTELSSLKESRGHLETLREQLHDGHLAYQELEAKLSDSILKHEESLAALETLKSKCTALELCVDSALKQAEQCKILNGEQALEINRLNSIVEKHEVEMSEKDAKSKALEFEHSLCKKNMDQKVIALGEVERLHGTCAEKLSSAKLELADLQAEHSLCIQKLAEKDMKMSVIQTVHMKCKQSLADKDARLAWTEEQLKKTSLLVSQTSTKLSTLQKEHSECAHKLKALRGETKYFDLLEKDVSMLKLKLSEQEQANALLSQECDEYIKRAEDHKVSKNESVKQLQHQLDACQIATDQLQRECQQLQAKYDELQAAAHCVDKIYEFWQDTQRDQFVEDVVKLHKSKTGRGCRGSIDADDQVVVEELRQEAADLEQRLQSKEEEYKQLDDEFNETVEHYEKRIAGYVADLGEMPSKIFDLTQENHKYKTEINQLTKKLERLEHKVDLFKKEKNDIEKSFSQATKQLRSLEGASSVGSPASSADSEQWSARVQVLEGEVKQSQELLADTERERKRLDEELDETVAHYEKLIADRAAQQHADSTLAEQMREQSRRDTEEMAKLNNALEQVQREKQELQQTLQETVQKLDSLKNLSTSKKASDSHAGSQITTPGLSSCGQRAARQQQLAHFDSRSQQEMEMTELKDRLHFAETNMSRYRDELRRLQNSGPLNNTMCQLQSSKPAQSRVQSACSAANSPVHGFEGGSHIVLSELVTDLKRDVYQLEKENKALKGEVNSVTQHLTHYKTKAQEWKTSSLLHQKNIAKLKTEIQSLKCEIERLKKRVEKIPASVQQFDNSVLSQHVSDTVSRAKNNHMLLSPLSDKDSAVESDNFHLHKVLQETNRIRKDPIQYDLPMKAHKKTENIPPSHDLRPVAAAPVRTYQHTPPTLLSSNSDLRGKASNISPVTRSIAGTTGLVTRTVSGSALTHTSPDTRVAGALTGSAAIIKGIRGDEAQKGSWDEIKLSTHGTETEDDCPALTASVTRSGKPLRRNWEPVKSSNAKYFLPDDKPKQKEDCKTQ